MSLFCIIRSKVETIEEVHLLIISKVSKILKRSISFQVVLIFPDLSACQCLVTGWFRTKFGWLNFLLSFISDLRII